MTASHVVAVPATTVWTSPGAPRDVDRALVADSPDPGGWCASHGRDDRLGLHGLVVTQALLGEPTEVLGERGRWSRVVLPWQPTALDPRGYPGWVPSAHLTRSDAGTDDEGVAVVRSLTALLRTTGGGMEVSCGTVLPARRAGDSEQAVAMPDGGLGWLDAADVTVRAAPFPGVADTAAVMSTVRRFLGLPYLWGGTTGWGVDCSGLVHLAYRVHGVVVPRDASDQHAEVTAVGMNEVAVGDLLFFAHPDEPPHHVGFATSTGPAERLSMLHAPGTGELVEDAPLASHRRAALTSAARVVP